MGETIVAKNLTGDGIPVYSAGRATDPWGFTSASKKRFRHGTVVIGARGTLGHPRLPNHDVFVSTQTTIAATPMDDVLPEYLCSALSGLDYSVLGAHQAVPMLTVDSLGAARILLPPLPEQKRIAAILSSVDEAIQATQAVIEQTRRVKEGLLQDLLTRGIGTDGFPHTRFKQTEIGEIPESWAVRTVGDLLEDGLLAEVQDGNHGEKHPKSADYVDTGVPFVMARDLEFGTINTEKCVFITQEQTETLRIGFSRPGDVLLTHKGTIGVVAIVPATLPLVMVTPQVTYYRVGDLEGLLPRFLALALSTPSFQRLIRSLSKQSTRAYIGIKAQKRLFLPVPPVNEQLRIVQDVAAATDVERTNETHLAGLRATKTGLLQDLLTGTVRVTP